jgi:hypothetical protein
VSVSPTTTERLTLALADPGSELFAFARLRRRRTRAAGAESAAQLLIIRAGHAVASVSAPWAATTEDGAWSAGELQARPQEGGWELTAPDGLRLSFAASAPAAQLALPQAGEAGEAQTLEQPCVVSGALAVAGDAVTVTALGQVSRGAEPPRAAVWRELDAWLPEGPAVSVRAAGERAEHHGEEAVAATIIDGEGQTAVLEPRVSTTYDGSGRVRRAGLELWPHEDSDYPRRLAGEALAQASFEEDGRAHELTFLRVHMEGREGLGRYELVR